MAAEFHRIKSSANISSPSPGSQIRISFFSLISFVSSCDNLQVRFCWDADSFLPPELCCSECLRFETSKDGGQVWTDVPHVYSLGTMMVFELPQQYLPDKALTWHDLLGDLQIRVVLRTPSASSMMRGIRQNFEFLGYALDAASHCFQHPDDIIVTFFNLPLYLLSRRESHYYFKPNLLELNAAQKKEERAVCTPEAANVAGGEQASAVAVPSFARGGGGATPVSECGIGVELVTEGSLFRGLIVTEELGEQACTRTTAC